MLSVLTKDSGFFKNKIYKRICVEENTFYNMQMAALKARKQPDECSRQQETDLTP